MYIDRMQLRLLPVPAARREASRTVVVSVDERANPTVGQVLAALGVPVAVASVDGRRVDPGESALEMLVDGSTIAAWVGESVPATVPVVGLAVVAGPDAGRSTSLGAGTHIVGREPSSVVAIDDRTVSRSHLEIISTVDTTSVRDVGSVNGSRMGGAWIETASPVIPKALIHIGASSVRFHTLAGSSVPPVGPARGGPR